ncbi:MAG: DUF58 domain-containing protein [Halanaerobiales bacterium]
MSNYINVFLALMAVIGVIGIATGSYIVLFMATLIVLAILFLRTWNKHIFDKLTINRYFKHNKVAAGQEIDYIIEIENRKFFPVIAMKMISTISTELDFLSGQTILKTKINKRFRDVFSLRWYEKIKRTYKIVPRRRGLKGIFSANLEYYDPFGFYKKFHQDGGRVRLYVHPRVLPVTIPKRDNMLFGTRVHRGWIFEDRLNKVGVRPYRSTDSFREINWKASAKSLELQSNIYKPSLDREVYIFHGLDIEKKWWLEETSNIMELSLICAASIAEMYFRKNYRIAFYSTLNAREESRTEYTSIELSPNGLQRDILLKMMALLNNNSNVSLARILEVELQKISRGSNIVIINESVNDEFRKTINRLKNSYQISVITIVSRKKNENKSGVKYENNENEYENKVDYKGNFNNKDMSLSINGVKQYFMKEEDWDEIEKVKLSG